MIKEKTQKTKKSRLNNESKKSKQPPIIIGNTIFETTIAWKKVASAYQKTLKKAAKKLKLAGFRTGKVPADVAEKNIDTTKLIEEALQQVLPDVYLVEIKKRKLEPLTVPRITPVTLAKGNDVVVKIEVAEKPTIDVKNYRKITKKAKQAAKKTHQSQTEKPQKLDEKHLLDHIYGALIQTIRPQVPELLITREVEYQLDQLIQRLKQAKIEFDAYLKQMGTDQRQLANNLATQAVGKMQLMFILDAIAKQEKLTINDKELDVYFDKTADQAMKIHKAEPNYRQYVKELLLRDKMVKHLLAI